MTPADTRLVRASLDQIPPGDPAPPYAPGVASLGLNEGLSGPFPSALAALERVLPELGRYPNRGSYELVAALAARHGVEPTQVFVAAGADAVIGYVCQAVLEPGDEIVTAWPSFPSFLRDPQKRDAVPVTVPLANNHVDLATMRAAVTPRTRLVFLATPKLEAQVIGAASVCCIAPTARRAIARARHALPRSLKHTGAASRFRWSMQVTQETGTNCLSLYRKTSRFLFKQSPHRLLRKVLSFSSL